MLIPEHPPDEAAGYWQRSSDLLAAQFAPRIPRHRDVPQRVARADDEVILGSWARIAISSQVEEEALQASANG